MKINFILKPIKYDSENRLFIVDDYCHVFKQVDSGGLHYIILPIREYQALKCLSFRGDTLASYGELAKIFYPMDSSDVSFQMPTIKRVIASLKKKIGHEFISAVSKQGYYSRRDELLENLDPVLVLSPLEQTPGTIYLVKYNKLEAKTQNPQKTSL